jgi:hypothetical protein
VAEGLVTRADVAVADPDMPRSRGCFPSRAALTVIPIGKVDLQKLQAIEWEKSEERNVVDWDF